MLRKEAKAYNKMIYGTEEYVYTTMQTSTNLSPIISSVKFLCLLNSTFSLINSDPNVQDILTTGNQFASMTNQLTISVNMIVAVFAMFGVGYYVGMQYSDNKTTVRFLVPITYCFVKTSHQ